MVELLVAAVLVEFDVVAKDVLLELKDGVVALVMVLLKLKDVVVALRVELLELEVVVAV